MRPVHWTIVLFVHKQVFQMQGSLMSISCKIKCNYLTLQTSDTVMTMFADKVIRHNLQLPGLPVHALPVLNHDWTNHNTNPMEHWCIATVAWTRCYCMTSSLCWRIMQGNQHLCQFQDYLLTFYSPWITSILMITKMYRFFVFPEDWLDCISPL